MPELTLHYRCAVCGNTDESRIQVDVDLDAAVRRAAQALSDLAHEDRPAGSVVAGDYDRDQARVALKAALGIGDMR